MLRKRCDCTESLPALVTFNLHATSRVHALVSAQVGELRVGLEANLASEWLDAAVDVRMLFEAAGSCECLPAFRTSVRSGSDVLGSNVSLEVAGVGEDFLAVFTNVASTLVVCYLVTNEVGFPVEYFGTLPALVFLFTLVAVF